MCQERDRVGSGGFGSEEVSGGFGRCCVKMKEVGVLEGGRCSGRVMGAVGVWWVQECVQVQRQSELVWCVQ